MRILDKQKDYYDYLAGIYGIDNAVFYDRRGSTKLTQDKLIRKFLYTSDFDYNKKTWGFYDDYECFNYLKNKRNKFIIIEAGYHQYMISLTQTSKTVKIKEKYPLRTILEFDGKFELVHVFDDHKHYFPSPLSLYAVNVYKSYISYPFRNEHAAGKMNYNYANDIKVYKGSLVNNPILIDTSIPSILKAHTIYTDIFDYISSKADFEIVDTRDDVAKAVDHGFDKKTSFRNM
jgi:hypothetical protein